LGTKIRLGIEPISRDFDIGVSWCDLYCGTPVVKREGYTSLEENLLEALWHPRAAFDTFLAALRTRVVAETEVL
jgi:hypothetical protein